MFTKTSCCVTADPGMPATATLEIQFLGVEMSAATGTKGCSSCDSTRSRLDAAIDAVRPALSAAGVAVVVAEQFVETEREVRALHLAASPTIRIGAVEVKPEHRGIGEDSRIWLWNGGEHSQPPQAMLVDAILRGYASGRASGGVESTGIPPYVRQFLKSEPSAKPMPTIEAAPQCGCGG